MAHLTLRSQLSARLRWSWPASLHQRRPGPPAVFPFWKKGGPTHTFIPAFLRLDADGPGTPLTDEMLRARW